MYSKILAPIFVAILVAGCSASTSDNTEIGSDCTGGKCDAFAPPTLLSLGTTIGACTTILDRSSTDEFFLFDKTECAFVGLEDATGSELNTVTVETVAQGTNRHSSARFDSNQLDGTAKPVASWNLEGYPIQSTVTAATVIKTTSGRLSEPETSASVILPKVVFDVTERPEMDTTTTLALPFHFDQVVVWPTQDFADKWAASEIRVVHVGIESSLDVAGTSREFSSSRFAVSGDDLAGLTKTVFSIPVDASSSPKIEVRVDSNDVSGAATLEGPGYYLLETDGTLTAATPEMVEARGMFDRDAENPQPLPGDDVDEPVTDPVDPPVDEDPCNGACDATEACVNAACVPLADQRQFSCNSTPSASCETDNDCAADNACAGGVCRLRECQFQSESCLSPFAVCEQDSDCDADHACAGGLCRRISCQRQTESCLSPFAVCEQETDCAADHACVEGICRRLTCQNQSESCFDPFAPCAGSADCAADHACVDSVCRRLTCQSQSTSCFQPFAPCNADSDCADGHVCGESQKCQRLTCLG